MEGFFKFGNRFSMKTHRIADTDEVPKEYIIIRIELDFCRITFITQCVHGDIPALIKNSLAFLT